MTIHLAGDIVNVISMKAGIEWHAKYVVADWGRVSVQA
jgi:hypothetical protein